MRVNISYSLELDEVLMEVDRLLKDVKERHHALDESHEAIQAYMSQENISELYKKIDEIRKSLTNIDWRLSDCNLILAGYQKAMLDTPAKQGSIDENILEEKVKQFGEKVSDLNATMAGMPARTATATAAARRQNEAQGSAEELQNLISKVMNPASFRMRQEKDKTDEENKKG